MAEVLDIIMALIEQTPWLCATFMVYKVCNSKSNKTLVGISDKFFIVSER